MKASFLRIVEVMALGLLVFGVLCVIVCFLEPDLGIFGVVVFGIWSLLSAIVFLKVRKKRKALKIATEGKVDVSVRKHSLMPKSVLPDFKKILDHKIKVEPEDLIPSEVIQRYLTTDHSKVSSIYDYYSYYRAEFDCILNSIPKYSFELGSEKVLRNKEILSPFEKSATLTKRTSRANLSNFVVVDTETTGIKTAGNDIIEVSAIKFENFIPVSMFTTLLKPRNSIPEDATRINGITDQMVESAPTFAQVKNSLEAFIGNGPIVAHNAEYDVKFLHVSGLNFPEKVRFFDTLELSRKYIKDCMDGGKLENYKLATVCNECNIYFDGAHRSAADALATGLLFIEIIKAVFEIKNIYEGM